MIRSLLSLGVAAAALFSSSPLLGQKPLEVSGKLADKTEWSGEVLVTGDLELGFRGELVIRPGTRITIAPQDKLQQGWNPDLVEWHIKGRIVVQGTTSEPVVISPDPSEAGAGAFGAGDSGTGSGRVRAKWHGIIIYDRSDEARRRCSVRGAIIEGAASGVQIPVSSPVLEDCVFLGCKTGVEVGSAYKNERFRGTEGGRSAAELRRCRFAGCGVGVYAELAGTPLIANCVFYRCNTGVGPKRPGYVSILRRPGCSIHSSAFVECGIAVFGCATVFNSILVDNRTAMQLSAYHDRIATDIDHVMLRNCLVESREQDIIGDTGVARALLRGQPNFRGPMGDLGKRGVPLPDALHLGQGSAAIGKAHHGGDLGPMARPRLRDEPFSAKIEGQPVRTVLALESDGKKTWRKAKDWQPGQKVGKGWWAAVTAHEEGAFDVRQAFGLDVDKVVLAVAFQSSSDGKRKLYINGDTDSVEVICNGQKAEGLAGRRRFARSGKAIDLPVVAGRNEVLLHVDFWGVAPRLLLDLDGSWQPVAVEASASGTAAEGGVAIKSTSAKKDRKGSWVDISFTGPLHWTLEGTADIVAMRGKGFGSRERSVDFRFVTPSKIRIGPLPKELAKQEVEFVFPGLRTAAGAPVEIEPKTVKLK